MAVTFIKVTRSNPDAIFASDLLALVQYGRVFINQLDKVKANMVRMFDDQVSPIDWALVEAMYGVPTGKGETVFNLVNGTRGSLSGQFQVSDGDTLIAEVG